MKDFRGVASETIKSLLSREEDGEMPGGGGNSTSQGMRALRSTGCSELKALGTHAVV